MINTTLIGLGRMGLRHLQNLLSLNLRVVGVCDSSAQALSAAKEVAGLSSSTLFADAREMLLRTRPELVLIATTAPAHAELTCMAAELGARFILCEKPMATSMADARRMVRTCADHGTRLAVNHQRRFMDQCQIPKKMLESEQFGGVTSVHVSAGNFGMAMNGSHHFEMFRFIAGASVTQAQGWLSEERVPNPRGPNFHDSAGSARLVAANGVRFTMDCGSDQGHGCRATFVARHGQIFVDELGGKINWTVRKSEHRSMPTTRYGLPWEEGEEKIKPTDAASSSQCVLRALLQDRNYPTGEDGLAAIKALVAVHASGEENSRVVRLDEKLAETRVFPWA